MSSRTNRIWNEYNSALYRYVLKKIGNQYDAEDVLQDIYIKIYRNVDKLEDLSKLKSWIYTIAKNTIIDFYKKKKESPTQAAYFENLFEENEETENMNKEASRCLEKLIDELPKEQGEAIRLHSIDKVKHEDIAEKTKTSISNSKMRVKRGKENLKALLLECCEFEVDSAGNIIDYKPRGDDCENCDCD